MPLSLQEVLISNVLIDMLVISNSIMDILNALLFWIQLILI